MDIAQKLKEEFKVEKWQVNAAINLIDEGNTIPFIARYRKEVTGSLDDEVLRKKNRCYPAFMNKGSLQMSYEIRYRRPRHL